MKWHNSSKKPKIGTIVLITSNTRIPTAFWDGKRWISSLYPMPAFPYEIKNVRKWAYIKDPNSWDNRKSSRWALHTPPHVPDTALAAPDGGSLHLG